MVELTREPIAASVADRVADDRAGAIVLFLGVARRFTDGRETDALDYESYEAMAVAELEKIEAEARRRWPLTQALIVHRLGPVAIGEASVAVAVSSPHRVDAFAAASWIMDTVKADAPIWKREHWSDGGEEWVHPTGEQTPGGPA